MHKLVSLLKQGKPPWETQDVEWSTPNGAYAITEVNTQWDFELEGFYLAHCLGTKNADEFNEAHRVFSVRDKLGFPHATILLLREGASSPYGFCRDLLTDNKMKLTTPYGTGWRKAGYSVLQVRGRQDDLARWEYYSIVRDWFEARGGKHNTVLSEEQVCRAVVAMQDKDLKYHYGYLLETNNVFTWAHWNKEIEARYAELGLVQTEE